MTRASHGQLVAIVTGVFLVAAFVAFVIAPDNFDSAYDDGGNRAEKLPPAPVAQRVDQDRSEPAAQATPQEEPEVTEPAPEAAEPEPEPEAKPEPKPEPNPEPAPAAAGAKNVPTAVLSGLGVPGIAARTGELLKRSGFKLGTVANAPAPSPVSYVLFASGKKPAAQAVAKRLKIGSVRKMDPAVRAAAPKDGVIVVLGSDRE